MTDSTLNALKQYTTVVADTGDIQAVVQWQPVDATTNPSLVLKAARHPAHTASVCDVVKHHRNKTLDEQVDRVLVTMGCTILQHIPGRVSTEVDARLSFDTQATIARAKRLVQLYEAAGIDAKQRVLIKIASTWEGIEAARVLEQEGIHCNLTLLFSIVQAHASAMAGVRLISPFVGRIYDWHKKQAGQNWVESEHAGHQDPGVESVKRIYAHFKNSGFATQVMGASFRNIEQIKALCGCDLLTISPELLTQLGQSTNPCPVSLSPEWAQTMPHLELPADEAGFRFALNEDAMATEKLSEGIRLFTQDTIKLEALLKNNAN